MHSRLVFVSLTGLLLLALSCQPAGDYRLSIVLPEGAGDVVNHLLIVTSAPLLEGCARLVTGELDPNNLPVYGQQTISAPFENIPSFRVTAGEVLLWAEGRTDLQSHPVIAGCKTVQVKAGVTLHVTLVLEWLCKPTPAGIEVLGNGRDDDCDGLTDECSHAQDCADNNTCTYDVCDLGVCHNAPLPNNSSCQDNNGCTRNDTCQDGACSGTATDCDPYGGVCANGVCDSESGSCIRELLPDDTECDDGRFCTWQDTCLLGHCSGTVQTCNDGDTCTLDWCDEALGGCAHLYRPVPGAEGPPGSATCDNGLDDDCDGRTDDEDENCHTCLLDENCFDANPCTIDTCQDGTCQNTPAADGNACEDGLYCTTGDAGGEQHCLAGVCMAQLRDCSVETTSCRVGVCSEADDRCLGVALADGMICDDHQYCTDADRCLGGECQGILRDCADDNACTHDTCDEMLNRCNHTLTPVPGAEGPIGDSSCFNGLDDDCDSRIDQFDGDCAGCLLATDCDDRNPCTNDTCTNGVCEYSPLPDNSVCDDGLYCTVFESCQTGSCQGEPNACDDGDRCTQDACLEDGDRCEHFSAPLPGAEGPPGEASCANQTDDDCDGLTDGADPNCVACASDTQCDDHNSCTLDACDDSICINTPVTDGNRCEDGLYCTVRDTCEQGACRPGSLMDCNSFAGPCQEASCDENENQCLIQNLTDGTSCDDGDDCTRNDSCNQGNCSGELLDFDQDSHPPQSCGGDDCDDADPAVHPGAAEESGAGSSCTNQLDDDCDGMTDDDDPGCSACVLDTDCDDANPCTSDVCLGTGSCANAPTAQGTPCDDGLYCNAADSCDGQGHCSLHEGNPCSGGLSCD